MEVFMKKFLSLILICVLLLSMPLAATAATYSDVSSNDWYTDAVRWASDELLMNGVGGGRFDPDGTVTRAQLVTILWRLEGTPAASGDPFTDNIQDWYKTAVAWAYNHGIVKGTGATTFSPEEPLTRAQAAAVFYRYSKDFHGYDTSKTAALTAFPDHGTVPDYATVPFSWTLAERLINGTEEDNVVLLAPERQTTRAQLATILKRFVTYTHTQGSLHKTIRVVDRFHYQLLNAEKQEYYRRMDAAVEQLETCFLMGTGEIPVETVTMIYNCYTEDNPEHFYLDLPYEMQYKTVNGVRSTYVILHYTDGNSRSGNTLSAELKANILAKKKRFDEKVHEIIHTIHVGLPQVEKEKVIHDWLITHNAYSSSALEKWKGQNLPYLPDEFSAYGAIINGTGVCEAYASAFQVLCHAMGIHCTSIEGNARADITEPFERHRWNAVKLDGEWYVVDVTFDDPIFKTETGATHDGPTTAAPFDHVHYQFFNRTCKGLENTHNPDQPLYHPTCTGTKYSYENYFNL